jgi:hypothetical protein
MTNKERLKEIYARLEQVPSSLWFSKAVPEEIIRGGTDVLGHLGQKQGGNASISSDGVFLGQQFIKVFGLKTFSKFAPVNYTAEDYYKEYPHTTVVLINDGYVLENYITPKIAILNAIRICMVYAQEKDS